MKNSYRPFVFWSLRALLGATALNLIAAPGAAFAADPIKIGVIAEAQAIAGASILQATQMAADEINAKGGIDGRKIEIVTYDDRSSAAEAVRAFQRAVSVEKVNIVIASYISEVVLALEPWASRLKTPVITPGAASGEISKSVHNDYEKNKYTFHGHLTSAGLALSVCDAAKDLLVDERHMKSAVIVSEDAAWTKPLDIGYEDCLPKVGLKVLDHIRFSPDITDFTPIFSKIEAIKPDVMITGISHVGVQPTVQWKNQQVPIPMFGISYQATNPSFGSDTNGAADGVLYQAIASPVAATTPKSIPFAEGFKARFGNFPAYAGYTAYDEVYYIADAVKRAGSADADKLVDALEKTDWEGTIGRVQFYGRDDEFTHSIKYGRGLVTGLMLQWQGGRPAPVWPKQVATSQTRFPDFLHQSPLAAAAGIAPLPTVIARPSSVAIAAQVPQTIPVTTPPADFGTRIALVIGNANYKDVPALPNPTRDAKAISEMLTKLGFQTVTLQTDLGREKMLDALRNFARQAQSADWALVYFAGHGMEVGGVNYLLPVDATIETDQDLTFVAIPLDQVLSATDRARKLRLVILDACRTNPYANRMKRTAEVSGRSVSTRGFARVEPNAGTLVVYAAKDGQIASDGDGVNSPFTTALLRNLAIPNIEIRRMFDNVRDDVQDITQQKQLPYTYGSITGRQDFYFAR